MISKKALLIAVGLAFALPSISHAMTREELVQEFMDKIAAKNAEEDKALENAQAETKRITENAAKEEANLQSSIESVNNLLKDTRLEKKTELTKALKELDQNVKTAYAANQKRLAGERELNRTIVGLHNKRVALVSKAIGDLTTIIKA